MARAIPKRFAAAWGTDARLQRQIAKFIKGCEKLAGYLAEFHNLFYINFVMDTR